MVRRVLDPHVGQSICGCTQLTEPWRGGGGMAYVNASWTKMVPPMMSMPTTVEPTKNEAYLASKSEVRTTENFRLGGLPGGVLELNLI